MIIAQSNDKDLDSKDVMLNPILLALSVAPALDSLFTYTPTTKQIKSI